MTSKEIYSYKHTASHFCASTYSNLLIFPYILITELLINLQDSVKERLFEI